MTEKRKRGRPPKHGAYSADVLLPLTNEKREMIIGLFRGEVVPLGRADAIAVELLARVLAKIELIDRWLQSNGLFADAVKGDPQPILKSYGQYVNAAARLCDQLGLTPTSRVRLGVGLIQTGDLAADIIRARGDRDDDVG